MSTKKSTKEVNVMARLEALQESIEKQVRENWERTVEFLPESPRKTVQQLTSDAEKAIANLRKRRENTLKDVRNRVVGISSDLRKRADGISKEVQKQIEGFLSPVTDRFDLASRSDVDRLRKRVAQLERKIAAQRASESAA